MHTWLILVVVIVTAVALTLFWVFLGEKAGAKNDLSSAKDRAQLLASCITAVGIVVAASLYALEQRWSPRFDVDIEANAIPLPDSVPPKALVHIVAAIHNEGRTTQTIRGIQAGLVGIRATPGGQTDEDGDYPGVRAGDAPPSGWKSIGAGETDLEYFDIAASCDWEFVRVVVKVPQPPYDASKSGEKIPVYERKLVVPLRSACEGVG